MQLGLVFFTICSYESKSTCELYKILRMNLSFHVVLESILHVLFSEEQTVSACMGPNGANTLAKLLIHLTE